MTTAEQIRLILDQRGLEELSTQELIELGGSCEELLRRRDRIARVVREVVEGKYPG